MRFFTRELLEQFACDNTCDLDDNNIIETKWRNAVESYRKYLESVSSSIEARLLDLVVKPNLHDISIESAQMKDEEVHLVLQDRLLVFERVRSLTVEGSLSAAWLYSELLLMGDGSVQLSILADAADIVIQFGSISAKSRVYPPQEYSDQQIQQILDEDEQLLKDLGINAETEVHWKPKNS